MDFSSMESLRKFMEHFSVNYPVLKASAEVLYLYGCVKSIPTSFLVNKKGHVVKMYHGAAMSTYERDIEMLLKE